MTNSWLMPATLASGLTLEEQQRVKHILLSHLHHDHIKDIPPLVDNLSGLENHQVVVASLPSVIAGLQKHVFNDMVFPNFFHLQGPRHSIVRAQSLESQKEVTVSGGISITPVPVNHTVVTVGYVIRNDQPPGSIVGIPITRKPFGKWLLAPLISKVCLLKSRFRIP